MRSLKAIALVFPLLGGCAIDPRDIGRAPHMTDVGSGLSGATALPPIFQKNATASVSRSLWDDRGEDLYRDARAVRIGDLVTVVISINDSAVLGNSSNRSRESDFEVNFDSAASLPIYSYKANGAGTTKSTSSTKGRGAIDRSEKIQLSVAAVVTDVLPNGNLVISGSQEVLVNFELRELKVAGIVRPRDVSRDNTVTYDKIAEARISYGGRGRMSEVQQPALIHQILDAIKPF